MFCDPHFIQMFKYIKPNPFSNQIAAIPYFYMESQTYKKQ